ncbi:MAG TPA: hypothetical protein VK698_23400 [Kofleriaceae bacterium]|nr:hypothetical protein [Kofleriaceae bacterium]
MANSTPSTDSKTQKVLRDLGKASEKTQSSAPPERIDNPFLHRKGPYLP